MRTLDRRHRTRPASHGGGHALVVIDIVLIALLVFALFVGLQRGLLASLAS